MSIEKQYPLGIPHEVVRAVEVAKHNANQRQKNAYREFCAKAKELK